MAKLNTADQMKAALESFEPSDIQFENEEALQKILKGFKKLPDAKQVLPAMFGLIERYPEAEMGSPGPLVDTIEELPAAAYEAMLIESVRRLPCFYNLWMVNRILNEKLPAARREVLLDLLRKVATNRKASALAKQEAKEYLEQQSA